ncbi:hypothetical protein RHMOL_Rhmol06G0305200 [Rhododendron molle]|uniref:Uncharacterized protein n=1 Tax=Rhododendron molle TaxID=49168 RepID=A0ACC0NI15_RHOML|nr:hypothetical protein RHMOL_Rhmol06G0305200 [Rhododendron molle]
MTAPVSKLLEETQPVSMAGSKIQAFWNHPAGPKTIHFWAPTFKWVISIANVADFSKPPEQLSYPHQTDFFVRFCSCCSQWTHLVSLQHTDHPPSMVLIHSLNKNQLGILTEYFVLRFQKNLNLVSVNLTMAATGFYQLSRKIQHDYYPEPEPAEAKE